MMSESAPGSGFGLALPSSRGSFPPVSASTVRDLARRWNGRLAHYRKHDNPEHLEALMTEALRYVGLHLENDLGDSSHWSVAPLSRRAALLLFLVDRRVVQRTIRSGRVGFEAQPDAVNWVLAQPSLIPYLIPTLEFLSALQAEQSRRPRSGKP